MKKAAPLLIASTILATGCSGARPVTPSMALAPCPGSPNCVSSQADTERHHIPPLTYDGSASDAMERLALTLSSMKRVTLVTQQPDYLHAEFTSALFRFVDDVEFSVDDKEKVIHVRSASRVGYSDLGANRKRVEKIRTVFESNKA